MVKARVLHGHTQVAGDRRRLARGEWLALALGLALALAVRLIYLALV